MTDLTPKQILNAMREGVEEAARRFGKKRKPAQPPRASAIARNGKASAAKALRSKPKRGIAGRTHRGQK